MSHDPKPEPVPYEPKVIGVLAQFAGPHELVDAARAIRDKGYRKVEAFSPFPIHGIDDALAAPKPILPWVVLCAGFTGLAVAILMQWYMNATEEPIPFSGYEYNISGKPAWSLPANIPVAFELTILFSAFTAFLGMIAFNKLPKFSNPLFRSAKFRRATDDGFFLLIDSDDPKFATDTLTSDFGAIGATHVESVYDEQPAPMPSFVGPVAIVLVVAALVPLAFVAMSRGGTSQTPRLSIWWDMDYQPKFKAQTTIDTDIFADGRSMRAPVAGTVSRSAVLDNPGLTLGYIPKAEPTTETSFLIPQEGDPGQESTTVDETTPEEATEGDTPEETTREGEAPAEGEPAAEEPATEEPATEEPAAATPAAPADGAAAAPAADPFDWVTEVPAAVPVNLDTLKRGQERYDIYCAVCHGLAGDGDGLVALRAQQLEQPTWRPPTSLHQETVLVQPVGKLFDTISNGNLAGVTPQGGVLRGGMPGYADQIPVEDRWAIALYVKALQKTRTATPDELTEQELNSLK